MSNDAPSAEDKAKYDAAKKELLHALTKKRNADKNLVRHHAPHANVSDAGSPSRHNWRFKYTASRVHT